MRVLLVCLGNICRSPLAEGILKSKLKSLGLTGWEVDSAGLGSWHVGELPDRRSITVARKYGIDITDQRARQFSQEDFERFDRIIVMDEQNLLQTLAQAKTTAEKAKVSMMLDALYPGENKDVPDPYYGGNEGFELVYELLDKACDRLVQELIKE